MAKKTSNLLKEIEKNKKMKSQVSTVFNKLPKKRGAGLRPIGGGFQSAANYFGGASQNLGGLFGDGFGGGFP